MWSYYYPVLAGLIILLFLQNVKRIAKNASTSFVSIYTIILFLYFIVLRAHEGIQGSSFVTIITFLSLFFVSSKDKVEALSFLTKVLTAIILLSLPLWIINNYFTSLPVFGSLNYSEGKGDAGTVVLSNYLFFIQPSDYDINRFYSVFDEPGVLGTLAAFVLFGNQYNFRRKKNIVILIGGFFTFSLAFYVLTLIGIVLINIKNIRAIAYSFFIIITISTSLFLILKDDPSFQRLIIERFLEIDSSLDRRHSFELNYIFDNFMGSIHFLWGLSKKDVVNITELGSGQGYKLFLIEYGIIGLVLVLIMYFFFKEKKSKYFYFALILFVLSFIQRPFLFTPWQITLFSLIIANLNVDKIFDRKSGLQSVR